MGFFLFWRVWLSVGFLLSGTSSIGEGGRWAFFSFSVFGFRWADGGLSSIGEALQLVRAFDGLFLF